MVLCIFFQRKYYSIQDIQKFEISKQICIESTNFKFHFTNNFNCNVEKRDSYFKNMNLSIQYNLFHLKIFCSWKRMKIREIQHISWSGFWVTYNICSTESDVSFLLNKLLRNLINFIQNFLTCLNLDILLTRSKKKVDRILKNR